MDNLARRLLEDRDFYYQFMSTLGNSIQEEEELFNSGALLAAQLAHNPPPRVRNHTGRFAGEIWIDDMMESPTDTHIFNAFRMNKFTFDRLCTQLSNRYGLVGGEGFSVREKVGTFLHILAKQESNRDTAERFGRSGWAVSKNFNEVLDVMEGFGADIVKPRDPQFRNIPDKILNDTLDAQHFKGAIGALDGTIVNAILPEALQMTSRGRQKATSMNVLAICDFDLLFTFVVTGWEGSCHDALVLEDARTSFNYPTPPRGKYYLGDKGYANRNSVMTPFTTSRYHSAQWRGAPPTGRKEIFNRAHASLRSAIERAYGVVKRRWKILECLPAYTPEKQNKMVAACFTLNNYIRLLDPLDSIFDSINNEYEMNAQNEDNIDNDEEDNLHEDNQPDPTSMENIRNEVADLIMAARGGRR